MMLIIIYNLNYVNLYFEIGRREEEMKEPFSGASGPGHLIAYVCVAIAAAAIIIISVVVVAVYRRRKKRTMSRAGKQVFSRPFAFEYVNSDYQNASGILLYGSMTGSWIC